jgi:diguanylate cyclase (GGDEF)-like protein
MDRDILHVDDDPAVIRVIGRILSGVATMRFATSAGDALRLARESVPDLILLDAEMPGMSGFQLFDSLRSDAGLRAVPVIFLTGHGDAAFEACALEMGAADFIAKPFKPAPVLARVRSQLRRIPGTADDAQGFPAASRTLAAATRRHFDAALTLEWQRALGAGDPTALLLIHVDQFERYREVQGRVRANADLRELVKVLQDVSRRPGDLLARCGEDAFALLLPRTRSAGAGHVACRILESVALLHELATQAGIARALSLSIGVAGYEESGHSSRPDPGDAPGSARDPSRHRAGDLIVAADEALRRARRAGGRQAWQRDLVEADAQPPVQRIAGPSRDPCPRAA